MFILHIPYEILQLDLNFNDKLFLGLVHTSNLKDTMLKMTNKRISNFLNINENTVSKCLSKLFKLHLINKKDEGYILNENLHHKIKNYTQKTIVLPHEVFGSDLPAGAKILWGEYNTQRENGYFASRQYTSQQIKASASSISNWTMLLEDNGFLEYRKVYSGYKYKQRLIKTTYYNR